jgi:uncharacterized protein RhaS with RHS repeats
MASVHTTNPQTWNRYAYVLNNPLRYMDPLGLWAISYQDEYDKKGHLKHRNILVTKSKEGDDAKSLAKQLGYTGSIQLSKMNNIVGRTFGGAESGLTEQAKYEAKGGGKTVSAT